MSAMTNREAIYDALVRFTDSLDLNDRDLCRSALFSDAIFDCTEFQRIGFSYPIFTGAESISTALITALGKLDTTHTVGNFRAEINGDTARATCNVSAYHFRKGDGVAVDKQDCFMNLNRYTAELARDGDLWKMKKLVIVPIWSLGDVEVMKR